MEQMLFQMNRWMNADHWTCWFRACLALFTSDRFWLPDGRQTFDLTSRLGGVRWEGGNRKKEGGSSLLGFQKEGRGVRQQRSPSPVQVFSSNERLFLILRVKIRRWTTLNTSPSLGNSLFCLFSLLEYNWHFILPRGGISKMHCTAQVNVQLNIWIVYSLK